jgi:hypothetical protein
MNEQCPWQVPFEPAVGRDFSETSQGLHSPLYAAFYCHPYFLILSEAKLNFVLQKNRFVRECRLQTFLAGGGGGAPG